MPWGAPELASRERRTVRVRVWGEGAAEPSAWSEDVVVEAGLLEPSDWTAAARPAAAAGARGHRGAGDPAPPRVRARQARRPRPAVRHRAGRVRGGDRTARSSATTCWPRAGPATEHRLRYQTYDVTDLLRRGPARDRRHPRRRLVPRPPRVHRWTAPLRRPDRRLRAAGGRPPRRDPHGRHDRRLVAVDASARRPGPTSTRARRSTSAASCPAGRTAGFDDADWTPVEVGSLDVGHPGRARPARRCGGPRPPGPGDHRPRRRARRWSTSARTWSAGSGFSLPDGPAGTEITVRHAEVLEHGELGHAAAAQGGRRPT